MGTLIYTETLDSERLEILKTLTSGIELSDYYMAGGTALSLQMGLRRSLDFDFFVPGVFDPDGILRQTEELFPDKMIIARELNHNTCSMTIGDIRVSFLGYPYELLSPRVRTEQFPGLSMAGIEDIALMKLSAIGGRGSKKDFFDLYQIMTNTDLCVSELCVSLYRKYGNNDFSYIGMGLNYFDDAEAQVLPETFVPYDWEKIKRYFSDIQPEFMDCLSRIALSVRHEDP